MIEAVLPAGVATEYAFDDVPAPGDGLFPEEQALVAGAVEKRRREFATVRHLARRALGGSGVRPPRSCRTRAVPRSGPTGSSAA